MLLSRSGQIDLRWDNEYESNRQLDLKICDKHRRALLDDYYDREKSKYVKYGQQGSTQSYGKLCGVPDHILTAGKYHDEKVPFSQNTLTREHSMTIAEMTGYLLPPGLRR